MPEINQNAEPQPERTENGGWTCPPGWAHPRCDCGHNYFHRRPVKCAPGTSPPGGMCEWCRQEAADAVAGSR